MDETEKWLRDNDPEYEKNVRGWRHIKTGAYKYDQVWERKGHRARFREVPVSPSYIAEMASISRELFPLTADPAESGRIGSN